MFEATNLAFHPDLTVMMLGDEGIGRSSLLMRFSEGTFSAETMPSVGMTMENIRVSFDKQNVKCTILDPSGNERYHETLFSWIEKAQVVLLCYDITDKRTFNNVKEWMNIVKEKCSTDVSVVIVALKLDLDAERVISYTHGATLAQELGVGFIETSAKSGVNVDYAFVDIIRSAWNKLCASLEDTFLDNASTCEPKSRKWLCNDWWIKRDRRLSQASLTIQAPLLKEDCCGRKCVYSDFIPTYENPAPTTNVGNLNPGLYAENELVYGLSPPLIEREFDWKAFLLLLIYGFVLPLVLLCQILFPNETLRWKSRHSGNLLAGTYFDKDVALFRLHLWIARKIRHPTKIISSESLFVGFSGRAATRPSSFYIGLGFLSTTILHTALVFNIWKDPFSNESMSQGAIYCIIWLTFCINRCYKVQVYPTINLQEHLSVFQQTVVKLSNDKYTTLFHMCEGIRCRLHTLKKETRSGYSFLYSFAALAMVSGPSYRHINQDFSDFWDILNVLSCFSKCEDIVD